MPLYTHREANMIRLYNTLSATIDDFVPLDTNVVKLYTCGPTVYNTLTVGNWLAYIRWDTLVRTLLLEGYAVERVMNITDVGHLVSDADEGEDKMQKGARRENMSAWDIAERYTVEFIQGMSELNLMSPQHLTKATGHIPLQIALIETLQAKGHTYLTSDGVYFDTATFPAYSDFAKLDIDGMEAGSRVAHVSEKRNISDFALWKFHTNDTTRDMQWNSPWGEGFPGWHIECSAMAMHYLGDTLDIHTGGIDHIPVHHTNEIAQSESASGKVFSRYWLHANFLMVDGKKISKSLDNGYTLKDLYTKGYSPHDFRMFAMQSHYKTESNFTWDNLDGAARRLKHWKESAVLRWQIHDTLAGDKSKSTADATTTLLARLEAAKTTITNDLNTPEVLKIVEEAFTIAAFHHTTLQQTAFESLLDFVENVLGIPIRIITPDIDDDAKKILLRRLQARLNQDWKLADALRDELLQRGIIVRDAADTQLWAWV